MRAAIVTIILASLLAACGGAQVSTAPVTTSAPTTTTEPTTDSKAEAHSMIERDP
jgi:hypothetical protein